MSIQMKKIYDPRDNLARVRRKPLERFMKGEYPQLYKVGMPATLMRTLLRENNVNRIPGAKEHTMGENPHVHREPVEDGTPKVSAEALLAAEWKKEDYSGMPYFELKKLCKERGIKSARTDKKPDLIARLNG